MQCPATVRILRHRHLLRSHWCRRAIVAAAFQHTQSIYLRYYFSDRETLIWHRCAPVCRPSNDKHFGLYHRHRPHSHIRDVQLLVDSIGQWRCSLQRLRPAFGSPTSYTRLYWFDAGEAALCHFHFHCSRTLCCDDYHSIAPFYNWNRHCPCVHCCRYHC